MIRVEKFTGPDEEWDTVAGLVLGWATKSHTISRLFDTVIGKLVP